jgi:hypothetical protein
MSAGADSAVAQQDVWPDETGTETLPANGQELVDHVAEEPEAQSRSRGRPILAGFLILLTLAWLVACGLTIYQTWASANLVTVVSWIATMSVPPALLALVWLIFGRTGRRETERFTHSVTTMRSESESLERVLAIVAERLTNNRVQLSEEAARLMQLGEEASDRLGRVTHYLASESAGLDSRSRAVEAAAAQARVDIGVLLADLPQAELVARSFSETLRAAGMNAHERAVSLEAQLAAITARAQDADSATGGAAERLSAHIARIETSAGVASQQLEGAAARLDALVDAALGRTTEAVESTRVALAAQAEGLFASVEQGRARFMEAGSDAGAQLSAQLAEAQALVAAIGAGIERQEQDSQQLVARLSAQITSLDERVSVLGQRAEGQSTQMATGLAELRDATATLRQEVDASTQEAAALIGRAGEMAGALDTVSERLRSELPPVLMDVEARAAAMRDTALSAVEPVRAMQEAAASGEAHLERGAQLLADSRTSLEALLASLDGGVTQIDARLRELAAAASQADDAASTLVRETGPELVETLVRVREAARAAANHAREAISAVIPESAASLADAARAAVGDSVTASVREQITELETSSQRAASAARKASERLTRQLLGLGQNAALLEARVEEERAARAEQEREALPRRVALLIESLNSTAIDVTKLLSNDVTDTAWQAYLKGDRGVFTRRAVRLLDSGEAREIQRHYDQELDFREQVNRYIADFEAMLRRVLADGDGNALAVTLLSSDMGKLYVALAQAIQHLRN